MQKIKLKKIRKSGFSIIELIVVIVTISILAALAVPNFLETKQRNRVKSAMQAVEHIMHALEMYSKESIEYQGITPFRYPPIEGSGTTNFLDNMYNVLSPYSSTNFKGVLGGEGWGIYALNPPATTYTIVVRADVPHPTLVTGIKTLTDKRIIAVYKGDRIPYP